MHKLTQTIRLAAFTILLLSLAVSSGCKDGSMGAHRWGGSPYGQGSVERQKARAVTFDPYPLNDVGPEIVGARPRGFTTPLSEPVRNELTAKQKSNDWSRYPGY